LAGELMSTCGLARTLLGGADDATAFNDPCRATKTFAGPASWR
jgi:hypothetical protein